VDDSFYSDLVSPEPISTNNQSEQNPRHNPSLDANADPTPNSEQASDQEQSNSQQQASLSPPIMSHNRVLSPSFLASLPPRPSPPPSPPKTPEIVPPSCSLIKFAFKQIMWDNEMKTETHFIEVFKYDKLWRKKFRNYLKWVKVVNDAIGEYFRRREGQAAINNLLESQRANLTSSTSQPIVLIQQPQNQPQSENVNQQLHQSPSDVPSNQLDEDTTDDQHKNNNNNQ
jgi:hypothetical protein